MKKSAAFDAYADNYDAALQAGIGVSGESRDFFVRGRIDWLKICLQKFGVHPETIMDYGCGTGSSAPALQSAFSARSVLGVDQSAEELALAQRDFATDAVRFRNIAEPPAPATIDLVYCNGVFHHIPPTDRPAALRYIHQSLKPGGWFAFWENNPWNLGTQYVMSRIAFDRDAIKVSSREARRLARAAGFEVTQTSYYFVFPKLLAALRFLEAPLSSLPLGAQYLVLCRRPA